LLDDQPIGALAPDRRKGGAECPRQRILAADDERNVAKLVPA
jgi:hypothetical protein